MSDNWKKHMQSLYDDKVWSAWTQTDWDNWVSECNNILRKDGKSKIEAKNTCDAGQTLATYIHKDKIKDKQQKIIGLLNAMKGLGFAGGSKKSRKSKASQKSRKVKSKSRKSKASQKSRQSRKQSKRLEREIQLSKEMSKRMSKKTPMIASSHGISLLKRSKRNMSKGRPLASARDFLLATSILTAALSPYDAHPMAQKSKIAPDTQVHLDWHKGQFPDKQLTSKQYKKLMKRSKRGKRLATIKEGGGRTRKMRGGNKYTWKCPFCETQLTFLSGQSGNLQKGIKFFNAHMKTRHNFSEERLAGIHNDAKEIDEAATILMSMKNSEEIKKFQDLLNSPYLNPQDAAITTTKNQLPTQRKIQVKIPMQNGEPVWWKASVIEELGDELWVKWDGLEIEGMPQYELIKQTDYEIEEGWSKTGGRKKRRTKKNRKKRTKRRRRKKRTRRK